MQTAQMQLSELRLQRKLTQRTVRIDSLPEVS